jgi:hypothetical protein
MADTMIPEPAHVTDLRSVDPHRGDLPRYRNSHYKRRQGELLLEDPLENGNNNDGDMVEISPEAKEAYFQSLETGADNTANEQDAAGF